MNNTEDSLDELDKQIRCWKYGVILYLGVVFASYFIWFALFIELPLSESSAEWGQAGDFIGGLLNPVVALAAFFWLTKGVRYQKVELSATRDALVKASDAQGEQAIQMSINVRLGALTALLNALTGEIADKRQTNIFYLTQMQVGQSGYVNSRVTTPYGDDVSFNAAKELIKELNDVIVGLIEKRQGLQEEINKILVNA